MNRCLQCYHSDGICYSRPPFQKGAERASIKSSEKKGGEGFQSIDQRKATRELNDEAAAVGPAVEWPTKLPPLIEMMKTARTLAEEHSLTFTNQAEL